MIYVDRQPRELPTTAPRDRGGAARPVARVANVAMLAVLSVLALAGCASKSTPTGLIYRVNPPGVMVQALRVDEGGSATATLRLANFSTVATTFAALDLELVFESTPPLRIVLEPGLDVPALTSDVIDTPLDLPPAARAAVSRAAGTGVLAYRIVGRVTTARPDGRHRVEFESRLSPVPGRPGEFR